MFGGVNLELQPTDLPEGLSPDAKDMAFLPGSAFTRPPLVRHSTLGTNRQIVYNTSFTKPDGTVVEIACDSQGGMYANGVLIGQTKAGNRFQSINAFGRCYLATSDGLHGADVPLQYDGNHLDRISQDGPGDAPSFAATAITGDTYPIATITQPAAQGGHGPWGFAYFLQCSQPAPAPNSLPGLQPGTTVTIYYADSTLSGPDADLVAAFNSGFPVYVYVSFTGTPQTLGPWTVRVTSIGDKQPPDGQPRSFYYFTFELPTSSLTFYAGSGHASYDANYQRTLATLTTTVPVPGLEVADTVAISSAGVSAYDGNQTITQTPTSAALQITQTSLTGGTALYHYTVITGAPPTAGQSVNITGTLNANGSLNGSNFPIASASGGTSGTFTITGFGATDYPNTSEAGQGETAGTVFAFDPGIAAVGTVISPIFGPSTLGTLTFGGSSAVVAPGVRKGVVIFQTRTGYLTIPSKVITFTVPLNTNAIAVSNIPIGPPNVIARILAFTGANGGKYFYLPIPPQTNNVISGTSTVVNDNTTTSAVFQFSDASLLSGTAIDIPGNNLFQQVVLGPILGVFAYAGRLFTWGERNKIQQFWNMGFEGGFYASTPNAPLGWTLGDSSGTLVSRGDYGQAWQIIGSGSGTDGMLSQPAFQDQNDIAILTPQTKYTFRVWSQGSGTVVAEFYSPTSGVLASASVPVVTAGGFAEAVFTVKTPVIIPSDTTLRVKVTGLAAGQTALLDEMELIYTDNPYILSARASYVQNFEAFDAITGIIGPASDPQPVMALQERRDTLAMLTFGPNGSLYETENTQSGEPATWNLRHVSAECGIISVWGITKFEDWFCWASDTGLRIYDGGTVDKMSQEVQPMWNSFNPPAKQYTVLANDPYLRRIYLLFASGTATVTDSTWVLDYRELNTASALANSGTLRIGYSGKTITTDLTRKWCPWSITANYCGMVSLQNGGAVMTFAGGTGASLDDAAHSAVYTLTEGSLAGIDADYGPFASYYTTYFFVGADDAQQRQVGVHRLLHGFMSLNVDGIGSIFIAPMLDRMGNPGRTSRAINISPNMARDIEIALNLTAERISYKIGCQPQGPQPAPSDAQAGFKISEMTVSVKTDPFAPIRGWNG